MSGRKSKSKGASGERELAKYLSEVFNGSFIRSNNSGAYIGGSNKHRKSTLSENQITSLKGDLVPPDFMPNLVIEAKSYADFRFHQLLEPGPVPQLDEWIDQCLETICDDDFWLVCFKITRIGWFVAVKQDFCENIVFDNYALYKQGPYGTFYVTDLKTFFEKNREEILRLSKNVDDGDKT